MICRCFKACNCTRIGTRRRGVINCRQDWSILLYPAGPCLSFFLPTISYYIIYHYLLLCTPPINSPPKKESKQKNHRHFTLATTFANVKWLLVVFTYSTHICLLSLGSSHSPLLCVCLMQPLLLQGASSTQTSKYMQQTQYKRLKALKELARESKTAERKSSLHSSRVYSGTKDN